MAEGMTLEEFLEEWNGPSETMTVHTSGSTGKPKPIQVSKERMLASAAMTCDFLGLEPGDTALLCMPLDYIAGRMMVVRSIQRGLRLISVKPSNHPLRTVLDRIDFAAMVPSQVHCTIEDAKESARFSTIRNVIIGGGAISPQLEKRLSAFPNRIWSSYGMTETLSHIALRRVGESLWYTPLDNVSVALDEEGCLTIDAPMVHEGTLHTNDIARIAPDGKRFMILGRRDNVICCGGIKLQAEEIEERLRPLVDGPMCITWTKDEKFGQVSVLILERPQETALAFSALERYMRPKRTIIAPVPLTGTGKTDRAAAAALAGDYTKE